MDYIDERENMLVTPEQWAAMDDKQKVDTCTKVALVDANGDPDVDTMKDFYETLFPAKVKQHYIDDDGKRKEKEFTRQTIVNRNFEKWTSGHIAKVERAEKRRAMEENQKIKQPDLNTKIKEADDKVKAKKTKK